MQVVRVVPGPVHTLQQKSNCPLLLKPTVQKLSAFRQCMDTHQKVASLHSNGMVCHELLVGHELGSCQHHECMSCHVLLWPCMVRGITSVVFPSKTTKNMTMHITKLVCYTPWANNGYKMCVYGIITKVSACSHIFHWFMAFCNVGEFCTLQMATWQLCRNQPKWSWMQVVFQQWKHGGAMMYANQCMVLNYVHVASNQPTNLDAH